MVKRWALLISAVMALGIAFAPASAQEASPAQSPAPTKPEGITSATVITVHGKIAKVDKAKKQVTLQLPEGNEVTVDVRNPYNLKAAKAGEPFVARYYELVTVRKKKPGESVPAASLKGGIATAQPGGRPGAVGQMHVTLLVTVDAIDEANGTVTVKAPDGTVETVKARNPQNLRRIKVGDELVVGISRAIGITLEKDSASGAS